MMLLLFFKLPFITTASLGFITPSGYVKCTLLEFNMFRQWIRKLKLDRIHQERRRERQVDKEKRREEQVRAQILRDGELYNMLRHREQNARELRERGIMRREADRKKYLKLQEIDKKRREKHRETMKRKKDINECQREKNLAQKEVEKVEEEEKVCFGLVMLNKVKWNRVGAVLLPVHWLLGNGRGDN